MDKPVQIDYRDQILDLPIATDDDGNTLYHCSEWAKGENIVIVFDKMGKGWIRGKGKKRYRVMKCYGKNSASFALFKSGRRE